MLWGADEIRLVMLYSKTLSQDWLRRIQDVRLSSETLNPKPFLHPGLSQSAGKLHKP